MAGFKSRLESLDKAKIAQEYAAGASLRQLIKKYGVGWEPLRRAIVENGVSMRPAGWHPKGWTPQSHRAAGAQLNENEINRLRRLVGYVPGQGEED